jgi:Reverse transcriptase (RNA-dependent DNA polymerase)
MMHMRFSPKHASTVSVALNLETGSLTPNWNVVFDDWFATVGNTVEEMPDDLETFVPVVQWSTVRFFLVLAMTLGWKTVSVDWANAFIQSKLEEPIFVHLPREFSSTLGPNTCLKLKKSLYGISIASRL